MLKTFFSRISTLENPPPWGAWTAVNTILVAFLAVIVCTGIVLTVFGDTQYTTLLGWTLAAVLAVAFVYFTRRKPEQRVALRLNPSEAPRDRVTTLQNILLLLLVGVGLAVALDVITIRLTGLSLPQPELVRPYFDVYANGFPVLFVSWALAFLLLVVAQPLADQLIFQGMVLPALRQSLGAWPGYLVSAALYGLFHLLVYSSPSSDATSLWYALFVPFIAGLIFSAVRLYSGSTRAAVLTHAAFGLFALVKLLTLVG
jgi:membrane protease YdiL (CAAX protease family)